MSEDLTRDQGEVKFVKPPIIPALLEGSLSEKAASYLESNRVKDAAFEERVRSLREYIVNNRVNADEIAPGVIEELFDQDGEITGTKWDKRRFSNGWKELPNSSLVYVEGRIQTYSRRLKEESIAEDEEISKVHTGAEKVELCYKDKEGKLVRMILDTSRIPGHENWGFEGSVGRLEDEVKEFFGNNESGGVDWRNTYVVQAVLDEVEKRGFDDDSKKL